MLLSNPGKYKNGRDCSALPYRMICLPSICLQTFLISSILKPSNVSGVCQCRTGHSRKTRGLKPDWWKRTKMYINIKINQSVKLLILIWGKLGSLSDAATVRETAGTDRIHQAWQLEWTVCDRERLEENVCENGKKLWESTCVCVTLCSKRWHSLLPAVFTKWVIEVRIHKHTIGSFMFIVLSKFALNYNFFRQEDWHHARSCKDEVRAKVSLAYHKDWIQETARSKYPLSFGRSAHLGMQIWSRRSAEVQAEH